MLSPVISKKTKQVFADRFFLHRLTQNGARSAGDDRSIPDAMQVMLELRRTVGAEAFHARMPRNQPLRGPE